MKISPITDRHFGGPPRPAFFQKFDLRTALLYAAVMTALVSARANDNWPQWRGPEGNGTSDSKNLPTEWSTNKNVIWKTDLPSWSGATPIVWEDRIFVTSPSKSESDPTSASQEERQGGGRFGGGGSYGVNDPGGNTLLLICILKKDGKILWQQELDKGNRLYRKQNARLPRR